MKNILFFTLFLNLYFITSCSTLNKTQPKIDCRNVLNEVDVQKEIETDLKARFPNYKEAFVSSAGLIFHMEGIRYYPVTVKTKENSVYSVIYNYSPSNHDCKKLEYQFIKLEQIL